MKPARGFFISAKEKLFCCAQEEDSFRNKDDKDTD